MSIFRDDKQEIPIEQIKDYHGTDTVMQVLSSDYQDIKKRFFDNNLPVQFFHPGIKKGEKIQKNVKAIAQESIPWTARIKKDGIDVGIRYCNNAIAGANGQLTFSPTHLDMVQPKWTYQREEIDKILVLMQTSHYKNGIISIVDDNANDQKRAESRGKSAAVAFHIFEEGGDLYANEEKLDKFCLSWGISIAGKFAVKKKNDLADAIELAENNKQWDFGFEAFKRALKDEDPYFDIRANVQSALDNCIIRWIPKQYQVQMRSGEIFVKVPPASAGNWKTYLFEVLSKNPDKYELIETAVDSEPKHELRKLEVKEEITEEFIMKQPYPDLKILYKEISGLPYKELNKMKQSELHALLIEHYVTKGLKRP